MFQDLLTLLPERLTHATPTMALVASVIGIVFLFAGGRVSREIITLTCVLVGGYIGMRLPAWCGWGVDGMGLAFAGAMLLGLRGYWLDRAWEGGLLAAILALWAGVGTWLWV